ncbi:MAG: NAD(P)-dependent oxidoreductase [Lachnospiraceae bacterium]|nr:NAD(P)-dependent oxidoreductase [Lachnospiraceae bacterium]
MKRAIVTGATGMIGTALIKELLRSDIEVTAIVRPDSDRADHLAGEVAKMGGLQENFHIVLLNLSDLGEDEAEIALRRVTGGKECADSEDICDMFFHLGWEGTFGLSRNDKELQDKNVKNTLDAVWLAYRLGASVFVGAGSQAEYGRVQDGIKLGAATPTHPENEYGRGKLKAGVDSRAVCKALGIRHIWCRILSVYGPGDGSKTMIMSGIYSLLRGERPKFTKGEQLWDYMYVEDTAKAMTLLAESGSDGGIYPLGSGRVRPLREYMEIIRDSIDENAELGIGEIEYAPGQVMYLCADISDLRKDTGFEPTTSFEEGIQKTIDWARGQINEEN